MGVGLLDERGNQVPVDHHCRDDYEGTEGSGPRAREFANDTQYKDPFIKEDIR